MTSNAKKIIKIAGFSVFFIFIILFAFSRSKDLIVGIKIKDVNIADGTTVTDNIMKITGKAKNAINLSLNGREISIDQEGNFNETIALLPGYNIINLRALDKFGYEDEKNYKVMYIPSERGEK